jgi:excinuclease ABC subunit C
LPSKAGVYVYLDKNGTVLYVGKAKDLKSRVSSYFQKSANLGAKTTVLVSQIHKINITIVESELEALLLEAFYIKKYNPKYNIRLTDSKMYLKIRITINDVYPRVLLARREDDKDSLYFGPYPSSGALKLVLKTIRRVFPYVSVPNHLKRICLYHHLGLCPCPPINDSPELRKEYKKNIKGIIRILEGESQKILKELEKERDKASKDEEYEKALILQKRINAMSLITTPFHKPFEYDVNPNLRDDKRQEELDALKEILNQHGLGLEKLERIECYDISNTQGTHAVGSMVVFVNGEKESSQYRKFRIRRDWEKPMTKVEKVSLEVKGPKHLANDFAMMREVLKRRLNHEEWDTPDLIIVDGGKGQVSSAITALAESGMVIPLVGLAKREETIIVPVIARNGVTRQSQTADGIDSDTPMVNTYQELLNLRFAGTKEEKNKTIVVNEEHFTEISLPKNSPPLFLIQRLRNEAHRFAITYHRKLRSKNALSK